jgi:membrane protein YdbS with pleckstrin-like domain
MKKNIVKLRITGMATFLIYLLSFMFAPSKTTSYNFIQIQQLLIIISIASFAIVVAMQVYRFYIKTYTKEEDEIV